MLMSVLGFDFLISLVEISYLMIRKEAESND